MRTYIIAVVSTFFFMGCSKQPGEGGLASIKGSVTKELRLVLTNPETVVSSFPAPDEDVWVVFGDNTSPDERYRTNYDGEFEIRFLKRGDYTVYVYSDDTTGSQNTSPNRMPIIREVTIDGRKEVVDLGEIIIYDKP